MKGALYLLSNFKTLSVSPTGWSRTHEIPSEISENESKNKKNRTEKGREEKRKTREIKIWTSVQPKKIAASPIKVNAKAN